MKGKSNFFSTLLLTIFFFTCRNKTINEDTEAIRAHDSLIEVNALLAEKKAVEKIIGKHYTNIKDLVNAIPNIAYDSNFLVYQYRPSLYKREYNLLKGIDSKGSDTVHDRTSERVMGKTKIENIYWIFIDHPFHNTPKWSVSEYSVLSLDSNCNFLKDTVFIRFRHSPEQKFQFFIDNKSLKVLSETFHCMEVGESLECDEKPETKEESIYQLSKTGEVVKIK